MATSNLARVNEEAFERRGDYEALLFEGAGMAQPSCFRWPRGWRAG